MVSLENAVFAEISRLAGSDDYTVINDWMSFTPGVDVEYMTKKVMDANPGVWTISFVRSEVRCLIDTVNDI